MTTTIGVGLSLARTPGMTIVNKFGRNTGVPNGSWEPVTSSGAQWLPQTGSGKTIRVKAGGDAADTAAGAGAREITIVGLDENWDEATEAIATNGTGASSATSTTFLRVFRAYVSGMGAYATAGGAANTALVTLETATGSVDVLEIPAGEGQSQHCSYTVPRNKKAIVYEAHGRVPSTKSASLRLVVRASADDAAAPYRAARVIGFRNEVVGSVSRRYDFNEPIVGPADIWVEAYGNGTGVSATAEFDIILVDI